MSVNDSCHSFVLQRTIWFEAEDSAIDGGEVQSGGPCWLSACLERHVAALAHRSETCTHTGQQLFILFISFCFTIFMQGPFHAAIFNIQQCLFCNQHDRWTIVLVNRTSTQNNCENSLFKDWLKPNLSENEYVDMAWRNSEISYFYLKIFWRLFRP